jgi:diaminohydroxyphosphoribosylaminopyrimidine deaminase / 5-amino-6-(5-phosphoribosylamino)uracil reductase
MLTMARATVNRKISADDRRHLQTAARLALRGHGNVEPNPMVGCVIVSSDGAVVGWGYHRHFGGPHAEIHALRMAGERAGGATCYVTLEPCNHTGQTGPCSEAIIEAGLARVVIGRSDPNPAASGGAARLREAGLDVTLSEDCPDVTAIIDPFAHRVRTGLPWVVVKWAQTLDGRIATRTGESRWISSPASRALVHRKRAKVDAIVTGIGTVLADDPMLTARNVRVRRVARRIVIDPRLEMPLDCALVRTAKDAPTVVACAGEVRDAKRDVVDELRRAGVEIFGVSERETASGLVRVTPVLKHLVSEHGATNVLVEAGPGLVSRMFEEGVVCELWSFIAPRLLGDEKAVPALHDRKAPHLADGIELHLLDHRQRGHDILLRYAVSSRSKHGM